MIGKITSVVALLLCLFVSVQAQDMNNVTAQQVLFEDQNMYRQGFTPNMYKFDFPQTNAINATGGTINIFNIDSDAGLYGLGVGQALFEQKGCSTVQPHIHPRGTEVSFVTKGNMTFGIVEELGGRTIIKNVLAGQSIVIPQGYIHYTQNLNEEAGEYIASFGTPDFGTIFIAQVFTFPASVIAASWGVSMDQATAVAKSASMASPITLGSCPQMMMGGGD